MVRNQDDNLAFDEGLKTDERFLGTERFPLSCAVVSLS